VCESWLVCSHVSQAVESSKSWLSRLVEATGTVGTAGTTGGVLVFAVVLIDLFEADLSCLDILCVKVSVKDIIVLTVNGPSERMTLTKAAIS
jgi:hypothetical protein